MLALADNSTLVLTVNARLARWLKLQYNREQAKSAAVWETPDIVPFDAWLKQTWIESWPAQYVLSDLQARHLWERIIQNDPETSRLDLLHLQGAARQAAEADALIRQYGVSDNADLFALSEETRSFHRWRQDYRNQLRKWNGLDPSELLSAVQKAMRDGSIPFPPAVVFAGFDEWTPELKHFIRFLEEKNVNVSHYPSAPKDSPETVRAEIREHEGSVRKYADPHEEVIQCARWVRSIMQPGKTIGIVVTRMEDYRDLLVRELKAELAPQSVFCWNGQEPPFNISLGASLARERAVDLALKLLGAARSTLPVTFYSQLLASPCFGNWNTERHARLNRERHVRKYGSVRIDVARELKAMNEDSLPAFPSALNAWIGWVRDSGRRRPSEWARQIGKLLNDMKWPRGERPLSSREFQVLDAWNECLDALATLDGVLGNIDRATTTATLERIVQDKVFQPKTREEPIQVVGLLEAAGMQFDHLWILGCHAETLPALHDPNPFIPFVLQRQHQLPHCTPNRSLRFYETVLARLLNAAPDVQLSFPEFSDDRELLLSPMLKTMEVVEPDPNALPSHRLIDRFHEKTVLEAVEDRKAIEMAEEEAAALRGGHSILKHQAECPFRAFALHRLRAEVPEWSEVDLDALQRGNLVHNILELFWKQVKTKKALDELATTGKHVPIVEEAVDAALQNLQKKTGFFSGQNEFKKLERERLCDLTLEWLEIERQRNDFEVVVVEGNVQYQIGKLNLNLKIDRIDRIGEEQSILIDYKTGETPKTHVLYDEDILEPQLPLYCLAYPADGTLFFKVKKGSYEFRGLIRETIKVIEKPKNQKSSNFGPKFTLGIEPTDWENPVKLWQKILNSIANSFGDGLLEVKPNPKANPCRNCELATLCRKAELLEIPVGEDEDEEVEE